MFTWYSLLKSDLTTFLLLLVTHETKRRISKNAFSIDGPRFALPQIPKAARQNKWK